MHLFHISEILQELSTLSHIFNVTLTYLFYVSKYVSKYILSDCYPKNILQKEYRIYIFIYIFTLKIKMNYSNILYEKE